MRRDRGFSLIELTVAVGLIALFAATGAGLTLANRSLAVAAAASEFDQLLDSARTMARQLGGGRISFAADGDGTIATFTTTNADGTVAPTTLPALHTRAHIAEQDSLGEPAFALVLHADGRLGGVPSGATGEVGCPASGRYDIRISAAGGSADRFLPCRTVLASGGPLTYTVWPPASIAPTPTPQCAGPCTPPPLPTASMPALTCPAGTSPVGDTCVPVPIPTPTSTPTPTAIVTPIPTSVPTPMPTPTAQPTASVTCDLVQAGTCYRRIAGPTLEMFDKTVSPAYTCDSSGSCQWDNRVGLATVSTRISYSFQPPTAPDNLAHQLLFIVDGVVSISANCAPFHVIAERSGAPPTDIPWYAITGGATGGSYTNGALLTGYGQPEIYAFRHDVTYRTFPSSGVIRQNTFDATQYSQTITSFLIANTVPLFGSAVSWSYSDANVKQGDFITYIPDFTDCASGLPEDQVIDDQLYGVTTIEVVVEVFQVM